MPPRYHVFLSHSSADKPAVEKLARKLREAGIEPFLDKWHLVPGDPWQEALEKALDQSSTCAVFIGPRELGPWHNEEMRVALDERTRNNSFRVIPVLLPGAQQPGMKGLPRFLTRLTWVDFRLGLEDAEALHRLISGIKGNPPGEGTASDEAHTDLNALPVEEVPLPGPLPAGSRMPLSHNPLFVGREEDLKTLARQLKAGETSAVGQVEIAAATGLGGIGKTQLASEFVHRYGRFFAGGVFWMSFAEAATVPIEVADCGRSLNLLSGFDALTLDQQVRLVEEAWQSPFPRLLVFDNCEEEELLRRWRPRFGNSKVLVTSRRPDWDPALGVKTVPLTTLPRPASVELLRRFRSDVQETEPSLDGTADAIAGELGDLPLALHLAGSFLRKYRASPHGQPVAYLEALRQRDLLDHPSLQGRGSGPSPTGHEGHVGRTFALSFERLEQSSSMDALAITLLARAAWLAPGEPLPRPLLLETVHANSGDLTADLLAEDALRRLTDLGLVETNEQSHLLMHRLVAAWARTVAEGEEARAAVEEAVLKEAKRLNETRNPAFLMAWQPHLRVITNRAIERGDRTAALLCAELGVHLWQAGAHSGARPYLEKAATLHREVSGTEHPDTAKSLNDLGRLFYSQGDYQMAHSYFEQGLAVRKKVLGPEHQDTAFSLNDLGVLLQAQGNFEEALPYFENALAIREKTLGPEHQDTAFSLNDLGSLLYAHGDFERAHLCFSRALAIQEQVLGTEHLDTATSLNNLATLLKEQRNFGVARLYLERALAINKKVLGPEHPNTANILNNFGVLLHDQGDFKAALSYHKRALAIREEVLGTGHPDTGKSLINLGSFYFAQRGFARARWYWERALAIFKTRLAPDHPDTKEARRNLSLLPGARKQRK